MKICEIFNIAAQMQQSQDRFNSQVRQADQGISTAPPNPSQATNMKWAKQNGFKSIRDFYNDMNTRAMSRDPQVRAEADKQLKQYEANVRADRLAMSAK